MIEFPILSLMTFMPLIGVLFLMLIRGHDATAVLYARWVALLFSGFVFVLALHALREFQVGAPGFQFVEKAAWFPSLNLNYHMGVDGISIYLVVLAAFLTPVCIISAWGSVKTRVREYMIAFLVLETFMIGTFCALDVVLFYVFFEGVLIPMFLIIGVWGGQNRVYAAFKFFLYTLLGSVLMLIAMLAMYAISGTTDMTAWAHYNFAPAVQFWLFLAFFASFAVKMPMWPVHTWLPDAHVEAPTAGSVILAGVLLKMGGYGFLRFSLPMFPDASEFFTPMIMTLSIIAIIYTSLVALVQDDMKKLIAYSSVAHMGFVTMGIFSGSVEGVQGAMFQMLSHGVISAALFLCVGVVYDRLHTREIAAYGGIVQNMPRYGVVFMILMLGSVGLPGTSGFVGEFLALLGAFKYSTWVAALAGLGVVLGAAYMLRLYRAVMFGPRVHADAAAMPDLTIREFYMFLPLVLMTIGFGVFPGGVLRHMEASVAAVVAQDQISVVPKSVTEKTEPLSVVPHTSPAQGDEHVVPSLPPRTAPLSKGESNAH
jgi:NADH-quinone oxidoreductase subunit M